MKGIISKDTNLSFFTYDLPAPDRWEQTYRIMFNEPQLEIEFQKLFLTNKDFSDWLDSKKELSEYRNFASIWWVFLDKCFKKESLFSIEARGILLEKQDTLNVLKELKSKMYNSKIILKRNMKDEICFPLIWYIVDSTFFEEIDQVENPKYNPDNKSTKPTIPIKNILATTRNALNDILKRKFVRIQQSVFLGETNDFYAPNVKTIDKGKTIYSYNPDLKAPDYEYDTKAKRFNSKNAVREIEDGYTLQEYVIKAYLPVFTLIKEYISYPNKKGELEFYSRFQKYAHYFHSFDNWIFILRLRPADEKSANQYEQYIAKKMTSLTGEVTPFKNLDNKIDEDLQNVESGKYDKGMTFVKIRLFSSNKIQYEELLNKYPFAMKIDTYSLNQVIDKNPKLSNETDVKKELKRLGFYFSIPISMVDMNKKEDQIEYEYRKEIEKKIVKLDYYTTFPTTKTLDQFINDQY